MSRDDPAVVRPQCATELGLVGRASLCQGLTAGHTLEPGRQVRPRYPWVR